MGEIQEKSGGNWDSSLWFLKWGHFLPIRQTQDNPVYAGLVEQMDDAVGEVLKVVDELGLGENTVIVFYLRQWRGCRR